MKHEWRAGPTTTTLQVCRPKPREEKRTNDAAADAFVVEKNEMRGICKLFLETKSLSDISLDSGVEFSSSFSPHSGGIDICRRFVVWFGKHAHDADENLLDALDGRPTLRCMLVVVWVVTRRVEDRNTDDTVGID